MKKFIIFLLGLLMLSAAVQADIPKTLHVVKARIQTADTTFVAYALIITEYLPEYSDSLLQVYKAEPRKFTELVNKMMFQDSISLYSKIFRLQKYGVILLPEDRETRIAKKDIKEIAMLKYYHSEYTGSQIKSEILSSDSTWTSWKVAHSERIAARTGMCHYTALCFNKLDDATRALLKEADEMFANRYGGPRAISDEEMIKLRKRLRKLRIVVFGQCYC